MLAFIKENLATIIVGLIVLSVVMAILIKKISDRIKGKKTCNCGCDECPSKSACK